MRGGSEKPRAGYLASVREVACRRDRLDDLEGELVVEVERMTGDGERVIYEFRLTVDGKEMMSGRAAVVLEVSSPKPRDAGP